MAGRSTSKKREKKYRITTQREKERKKLQRR